MLTVDNQNLTVCYNVTAKVNFKIKMQKQTVKPCSSKP